MKLSVHKFKHITDREFIIPDTGLILISGSNGSGKSTLLGALIWVLFGGAGPYQVTLIFKFNEKEFKIFRSSKPKRLEVSNGENCFIDEAGQSHINAIFSSYDGFEVSNGLYQGILSSLPFISQSERIERVQHICEVKDDSAEFESKCVAKVKLLERDKIKHASIFESIKLDRGDLLETDSTKEEIMAEISSISTQIRSMSETKRKEEILKIVPEKSNTGELLKQRSTLEVAKTIGEKYDKLDKLSKELDEKKVSIEEERRIAIDEQLKFILTDKEVKELKTQIKLKKILNKRDEFVEALTPIMEKLDFEGDLIEQLKTIKDNPSEGFTCKCGIRYAIHEGELSEDETVSTAQSLLSKIDDEIIEFFGTDQFDFDLEDAADKLFKNETCRRGVEDIKKRRNPQLERLTVEVNKMRDEISTLERPKKTVREMEIEIATLTATLKEELKYDKLREEALRIKSTITETKDDLAESLDELTAKHRFLLSKEKIEAKDLILKIDKSTKIIKETLKVLKDIRGERLELFNKHLGVLVESNISQLFSSDVKFVFETLTTEARPTVKLRGGDLTTRDLSGGEQQRLNLAFFSATNDILDIPIMILDESLSFVDDEHFQKAMEFLKKKSEKSLVLLVTHKEVVSDLVIEL